MTRILTEMKNISNLLFCGAKISILCTFLKLLAYFYYHGSCVSLSNKRQLWRLFHLWLCGFSSTKNFARFIPKITKMHLKLSTTKTNKTTLN